eukprot:TRINITY_DN11857_c0_g1_i1.p1 TRINITY_DN11857_c0_g1~~TRINITY_DN11857_c0_g1_i1.p1  ORF type:complete len:184 (+),score=10.67 TRINITY_DN11857_c0_g1_i1:593-1144(+)
MEQIYVHSKLMIVDDRYVICGSANINDRSMLGDRDSEIALIVKGNKICNSMMNGKPYEVREFAHNLRIKLWAEHLGMKLNKAVKLLKDPVHDLVYNGLWANRARRNQKGYGMIGYVISQNDVHSMVRRFLSDAGSISSDVYLNVQTEMKAPNIRGHLVPYPLERDPTLSSTLQDKFLPDEVFQ